LNINLEKLVFLEMTNKEMALLPNKDYYETFKALSENEKKYFGSLSRQIHNIWTHINTQSIPNVFTKQADTIVEYHECVEKVDQLILKCHYDYGTTLKRTMNEKLKEAIIKFLGRDFYDNNFE
jgi:hypothetical protein